MTNFDAVAEKAIADLEARLTKLAELCSAKMAKKDLLVYGSLPHIENIVGIEALDRSILRLQHAKAKERWLGLFEQLAGCL